MHTRSFHLIWVSFTLMLILLLAAGLTPGLALAHGEASLTVAPEVVVPGGTITATGEGVEPGESFTITVEGMSFQATLGTVTVGDDEDFHQEFVIPAETPPGIYQVKATSPEGEVLTAELTVEAGTTTTEAATPAEPSAELMKVDRRRSTGELVTVVVGLLVSAGLGLALVRVREE